MFEIRPAREQDCPRMLELLREICDLHSDIRPDLFKKGNSKYTAQSLRELLGEENQLPFVAVDENDFVLGYILCILIDHRADSARCDNLELYVNDLCVAPECRHSGIGGALFDHALAVAEDIGCHNLTLNVWEGNAAALGFYERRGMRLQKRGMEIVLSRQSRGAQRFEYKEASLEELEQLWDMNIAAHSGDERWLRWKDEYIEYNLNGKARTFAVLCGTQPVGEGTLLYSPECLAVAGRRCLADNAAVANINALRIAEQYEGRGHISALVRVMEKHALGRGCSRLTIGVEARLTRSLSIYLHWGYDRFLEAHSKQGETVLYYEKLLRA